MNSSVSPRQKYILATVIFIFLLHIDQSVRSQSVTFTPNGVWLPNMTTNERITMPVKMGQLVFDTNTKSIWYHTGIGGEWKELITVKPTADNLGNHTAVQNLNLGGYYLSPDGSESGLKFNSNQLLLQLPKPRFQLGTNLSQSSQLNFANYDRNWTISTSQERFAIKDSTFQTSPVVIEKNAFHNMLYIKGDKVGIGTTNPYEKLDVAGKVKMTGFQLYTGTNTAGYILQSDSGGNGTWVNLATAGFNYWALSNGSMYPNQNVNVGIGTETPTSKLEVNGKLKSTELEGITKTKTAALQVTNGAVNGYILQSDASGNATWKDPASLPITFTETDPKVGTLTANMLPKWNGTKLIDGTMVDNGNIGIGVASPTNKLEINGTTKTTHIEATSGTKTSTLQVTNGASNGYILQSDASGNATWKDPANLPINVVETDPKIGNQLSNYVPSWNGSQLIKGGIYDDGYGNIGIFNTDPKAPFSVGESYTTNLGAITYFNSAGNKPVVIANIDKAVSANNKGLMLGERGNEIQGRSGNALVTNSDLILNPYSGNVGVGTFSPSTKLDINGKIKATSVQLTDGAVNGFILQSDENGNASWVSPSFSETDPKIGNLTSNYLPKWNGSTLANTQVFDNGSNVGIGTNTPSVKLDINGKTKATQLQLTTGATNNYVLKSDASGNASWADPTHLTTILQDADGNTKIEVEKSANENVIHFSTDGKERLAIRGAQMTVSNSGGSTFLGYAAGQNDDLSDNINTYVGYFSGNKTVTGIGNLGLGGFAMENNTTGSFNVAIGLQSLYQATTSSNNTAVGAFAGQFATGSGNVFIGNRAGENETGSNKLYIDNTDTATPLIYGDFTSNVLTVNGKMGIGTTTPTQAKFVVNGNAGNTLSYAYFNSSNQTGTVTNYTANYSIYASDRIAATEFNAFSDARIKDIKGISNNKKDLETLSKIEITDYQFKDKIGKGHGQYKKVIAQQVETVYPQAVSKMTDFIPDIYQLAQIENNFIKLPNHNLKTGEKVKLIFGEKQNVFEVESVNENGFKIVNRNSEIVNSTSVFVYGREVSDFRSVDYEALTALNVSATQALLKRIEQLEFENKQYKNEFKSFRTELEQLKTVLDKRDVLGVK